MCPQGPCSSCLYHSCRAVLCKLPTRSFALCLSVRDVIFFLHLFNLVTLECKPLRDRIWGHRRPASLLPASSALAQHRAERSACLLMRVGSAAGTRCSKPKLRPHKGERDELTAVDLFSLLEGQVTTCWERKAVNTQCKSRAFSS